MDFAAKLVARLEEAVAETEERRSNLLFELGRYNGRLETLLACGYIAPTKAPSNKPIIPPKSAPKNRATSFSANQNSA